MKGSNPLNTLQVLQMTDGKQIQSLLNLIKEVRDNSDKFIQRRVVVFKNGYELSVIYGLGTYGNTSGLFEVAAFDTSGNWCTHLLEDDLNDSVIGWCTHEDVVKYMFKLGSL